MENKVTTSTAITHLDFFSTSIYWIFKPFWIYLLSDYLEKAMNTAQYQVANVFRGYRRGEMHLLYSIDLQVSLSAATHATEKEPHQWENIQ